MLTVSILQSRDHFSQSSPGLSPTALEWDMKLWWVHLEAMVATLMAFQHTNSQEHRENFIKIFNYTFDKVELHNDKKDISLLVSIVSSVWRRVGRIPGPAGKGQDGFQGRTLQRMLSPSPGSDDL